MGNVTGLMERLMSQLWYDQYERPLCMDKYTRPKDGRRPVVRSETPADDFGDSNDEGWAEPSGELLVLLSLSRTWWRRSPLIYESARLRREFKGRVDRLVTAFDSYDTVTIHTALVAQSADVGSLSRSLWSENLNPSGSRV